MTRVNFGVKQIKLLDTHLSNEFIEIARIPNKLAAGKTKGSVTPYFKLNKGHELYFVDKIKYIERRYNGIILEMKRRNIKVNQEFVNTFNKSVEWIKTNLPSHYNDVDDSCGFPILRERLHERYLTMSKGKMKYCGKSVSVEEALQILDM